MDRKQRNETSLEEIRHLLSHLHGEVTALEESYTSVAPGPPEIRRASEH